MICKACGQLIFGTSLSALGATWHPQHFVCAACGRPIATRSFNVDQQGLPYHAECYVNVVAPHCVYCGKPLLGEYLVDYWGAQFCKEHQQQFPHCDFCGRLIPPGDQETGAESVRCPICRASAISTVEEARPLFRALIQWVGEQGLRYNSLPLSLEICQRARLLEYLQGRGTAHSLGATMSEVHVQNGRIINSLVKGVAVLTGLPATLFEGITIHELGHVWLIVHGILQLPPWAEEGFCELLSYRYYSSLNTPEGNYHAMNITKSTNPVYGDGFRRVQAISERMGWQGFLEALSTTKQVPRG